MANQITLREEHLHSHKVQQDIYKDAVWLVSLRTNIPDEVFRTLVYFGYRTCKSVLVQNGFTKSPTAGFDTLRDTDNLLKSAVVKKWNWAETNSTAWSPWPVLVQIESMMRSLYFGCHLFDAEKGRYLSRSRWILHKCFSCYMARMLASKCTVETKSLPKFPQELAAKVADGVFGAKCSDVLLMRETIVVR